MYNNNDIVVRIGNFKYDAEGSIYKILNGNSNECERISDGDIIFPDDHNLRLATSNEILAYNQEIRNINDIKELTYEIY